MSSSHANRYTPEFKQRAVQLYESRSPVTYAEVARELGIDAGTLSKWVAQAKPEEVGAYPTTRSRWPRSFEGSGGRTTASSVRTRYF